MKCPKCRNTDIKIVESIKRANILIMISITILFIILMIAFFNFKLYAQATLTIVFYVIISIIYKICDAWLRRKSHTKAICKNCGHFWYID